MTALDARLHAYRADLADSALVGRVTADRFAPGEPFHILPPASPLRQSPRPDATLLTEALCGEHVTVFDFAGEWAWVQLRDDHYVGWLPAADIGAGWPEATHKIAAIRTFAFTEPDIKTPPVASLPLGARVTVRGEAEDRNARYGLIEPAGAVPLQHLADPDRYETDWTAVAERFMGSPYLWGGKTDIGIDCSGLVQVALAACGINLPRDADMQEAALGTDHAVDQQAGLERGDLVFWKGHVGIMLDGIRLLHANSFHMAVTIEPLTAAVARSETKGSRVTGIRRPATKRP